MQIPPCNLHTYIHRAVHIGEGFSPVIHELKYVEVLDRCSCHNLPWERTTRDWLLLTHHSCYLSFSYLSFQQVMGASEDQRLHKAVWLQLDL